MKTLLLCAALFFSSVSVANAGSIRVYNNDSKNHTIELKCSGSSKTVEVKRSSTATYTFHSSARSCDIVGGTVKFPVKVLKDGTKWKFKNGEAKKN